MKKERILRLVKYLVLILGAIIMLFPIIWMVSTSLKDPFKAFQRPIQLVPDPIVFENYTDLFKNYNAWSYLWNTIKLCLLNVGGSILSCSLVAYGLTFIPFKHKKVFISLMLMTMMVPGAVIFFPRFLIYVKLGWYGTSLPLWLPAFMGNAYFIILLRQYFLSIPQPIIDAARVSGCNHFTMMTKIVLPMARPILIMIFISSFTYTWNDLFGPLIYILDESDKTWSLLLSYFSSIHSTESEIPRTMAAGLISIIPTVLVYFLAQKEMEQAFIFKREE